MQQAGMVAANRMNKGPPRRTERTPDDASELRIVLVADVLEHADRREHILATGYVAIVILDELHAVLQLLLPGSLSRERNLLARNIECPDARAVAAGHVQRQAAPAETGLDHRIPRLQTQLPTYVLPPV